MIVALHKESGSHMMCENHNNMFDDNSQLNKHRILERHPPTQADTHGSEQRPSLSLLNIVNEIQYQSGSKRFKSRQLPATLVNILDG
jgi:hypothetical protein